MERIKVSERSGEVQLARDGLWKNKWKNLFLLEPSSPTAGMKPEVPSL